MSNNTIYCDSYDHIAEGVWDGYAGNGEPYGFFNVALSSKFGRTGEKVRENCEGTNPCGEISLADKECCNLAELYLNNIESKQELIECSKLLYKTQKAICALPFIHGETNKIVHKNFRIGQGVTGICQSLHNEKLDWLSECYEALREFDKEWSKKQGWPESIKLTTVKPSGTLSLLAGATPGVHPAYSQYYIRRVRMSSQDALVDTCRNMGYLVEYVKNFDGSVNRDTVIVEFPCESGPNARLAKDMRAVDQLNLIKEIQKKWSDNAVSCTVYYLKEELGDIKGWLRENYKNNIKSVSFLLHSDHGFAQAPYEELAKEDYKKLCSTIKKVTAVSVGNGQTIEGLECEGGICPVK
jgi:adenosylcobalamin-dependent ribonucleoside-triphosphate reductase